MTVVDPAPTAAPRNSLVDHPRNASALLDRVRCLDSRRRDIASQSANDDAARLQCRSGGTTPIHVAIANGRPQPGNKGGSCGDVR
jgi:hypothetical protein